MDDIDTSALALAGDNGSSHAEAPLARSRPRALSSRLEDAD